jgi:hypothetical protein
LNGRVLVVVVLVAALCLLGLAIRVLARRRRDEIRSIDQYHERLDTLHVESHDRGGSVRVMHGDEPSAAVLSPERPRLSPDAVHVDVSLSPLRPERHGRHDREWALGRMQPRARVDTATTLVVTIVVTVLVAIALVGYLIQRGRDDSSTPPPTVTTTTVGSAVSQAHDLRTVNVAWRVGGA